MIGWLADRWWSWKNDAALRELDERAEYLKREGERLDQCMTEEFGPDWREQSNNRLAQIMSVRFTGT